MASLTMAASLVGTATPSANRGRLVAVKASIGSESRRVAAKPAESVEVRADNSNNGRRAVMFAAAAAAVTAVVSRGGDAFAGEEGPKRGSAEAKKKYMPICVTMPTARICHS